MSFESILPSLITSVREFLMLSNTNGDDETMDNIILDAFLLRTIFMYFFELTASASKFASVFAAVLESESAISVTVFTAPSATDVACSTAAVTCSVTAVTCSETCSVTSATCSVTNETAESLAMETCIVIAPTSSVSAVCASEIFSAASASASVTVSTTGATTFSTPPSGVTTGACGSTTFFFLG